MNCTDASIDQGLKSSFDEHGEKVAAASELLPAWFIGRMMDDRWRFGLMLNTGITLGVSHITNVTSDAAGNVWLDCEMLSDDPEQTASIKLLTAPCPERRHVSVNTAHIVAAFEIAFT